MLFLAIVNYFSLDYLQGYKLFHLKLLLFIINYFTLNFCGNLKEF